MQCVWFTASGLWVRTFSDSLSLHWVHSESLYTKCNWINQIGWKENAWVLLIVEFVINHSKLDITLWKLITWGEENRRNILKYCSISIFKERPWNYCWPRNNNAKDSFFILKWDPGVIDKTDWNAFYTKIPMTKLKYIERWMSWH